LRRDPGGEVGEGGKSKFHALRLACSCGHNYLKVGLAAAGCS
jgi:hypothetical protein